MALYLIVWQPTFFTSSWSKSDYLVCQPFFVNKFGPIIRWLTNCLLPNDWLLVPCCLSWWNQMRIYLWSGFAHWSKAMVQDIAQMYSTKLGSFVHSTQWNLRSHPSQSQNEHRGGHDLFDCNADNRGEILSSLEGCGRSLGQPSNHFDIPDTGIDRIWDRLLWDRSSAFYSSAHNDNG